MRIKKMNNKKDAYLIMAHHNFSQILLERDTDIIIFSQENAHH